MTSRGVVVAALAAALAAAAVLAPTDSGPPSGQGGARTTTRLELGPGLDPAAFARATAIQEYRLPDDHGPHLEYQTEWWYYTGNLAASDGRRFGFQLTFFRRGLAPGAPPDGPGLATRQI